jgi:hypothetical protein
MITTRENRQLAIKWAKSKVKQTGSMVLSDQYWTAFADQTQILNAKRKLKQLGILAFDIGKDGAILIHKNNPKLAVETFTSDDGKTYISGTYTNIVDGETNVAVLVSEGVR